jgi:hypothetical protein
MSKNTVMKILGLVGAAAAAAAVALQTGDAKAAVMAGAAAIVTGIAGLLHAVPGQS